LKITVKNGNVERALKIFKRKSSEIIWDYRKNEYYEKSSTKKHVSRKAAVKREQKRQGVNKHVKRY